MSGEHTEDTPASALPSRGARRGRRALRGVVNTLGELLLVAALVIGLYVVWQLKWTGVEAQETQEAAAVSSAWSAPGGGGEDGTYAIAPDQDPGSAPYSTRVPATGRLVAAIYIPRFGSTWQRTVVQGTDLRQLNTGGMGHYVSSSMPGAVGNFALAGHRAGYGDPLADIDKLQEGDAIIVRTEDYWYVYHYTSSEIVTPDAIDVTWPVPHDQDATPTERLITMTTCHPRLQTATHRWVAYGELAHWNRVSEGIPSELAPAVQASHGTLFTRTTAGRAAGGTSAAGGTGDDAAATGVRALLRDPALACRALLLCYTVVWLSAAIAWRWPGLRGRRGQPRPDTPDGPIGIVTRIQPGVAPVRVAQTAILAAAGVAALFAWAFPWAASTLPWLQVASSYVVVG